MAMPREGGALTHVKAVIFSKDRPLQLDATLRSLKLNCADLGECTTSVLYTTSSARFAAQYRVVANEHSDVAFVQETRFKSDLVALVQDSAHVMFVVDDSLFVGPLSIEQSTTVLANDPSCIGVSFRLGQNTAYCYAQNQRQGIPQFQGVGDRLLAFDWSTAELDFGYPLDLSSSIYRTSDLLPLLVELEYRNPNTLESVLAERARGFEHTRPRLACYEQSVAFSVPINLVQTAWRNRVGSNPAYSKEALARDFDRGQRIDVARYEGHTAKACHEELELVYRQDPMIPVVSVVIPCYGQAQYLSEAVASVVAQTFTDWELLIVDDGSQDHTVEVARSLLDQYPDRRLRLLSGPNRGVAAARNLGIESTLGRYILPLDADDSISPDMLRQTVAVLESEERVAVVYTDLQQFGEGVKTVRAADFDGNVLPEDNQLNYCALYRREVWEAVGGYNPNMKWGYEDWDFWIGALEHGYSAKRVPGPLFHYRVNSSGMYRLALEHDEELRGQIRRNHPTLYRRRNRWARWLRMRPPRLAYRLRRSADAVARVLAGSDRD